MRFQSRSWKKYKIIFVKTSTPPIDNARVGFPVISSETIIVSMVPTVRHEIDLRILLYDFSFINCNKKALLVTRRAWYNFQDFTQLYNNLLRQS
jgi:hypothetical protein